MRIHIAGRQSQDVEGGAAEPNGDSRRTRLIAWVAVAIVVAVVATATITAVITTALVTSDQSSKQFATRSDSSRLETTSGATTTTPQREYVVGQNVTNGGITVTINQVSSPPSFQQVSNSMQKTSEYAEFVSVSPRAGGKFIRVDATVLNGTQKAIDLTCSWPINDVAVDSSNHNYKHVDDLYKIPGTPECNEDLNPGFSAKMTWIYEVPASANVIGFAFADTATDPYDYSIIRLGSY
ncbi:hypothetical protein J8M97_17385 [Gordonia polyisoprenivorans]|uniref:hypothetical protein n=1 Tax=Gordonia polyisoprenivorans TaxID=84595 RepID=UPI0011D28748|nr:hypothetical protein [Gordonia polyisoprenivorans]QUD81551.1 hypothetical protein J8M97_17385 [Gordonia polyisoprenivorans]UZF57747.1 hypothetical protein LH935_07100 [Gordonia polyisoprenivorans]